MTSDTDDFKMICIYENVLDFAYFFKKWGDLSRFFKKVQHFQIYFHVPNMFLTLLD